MKFKKKDYERAYNKIAKMMFPSGMRGGRIIARLVKKKGNSVFPMYRSALVVTPTKLGNIKLEFYHDPAWLGNERNKKTIKNFKDADTIFLNGQRSGVDKWYQYENRNSSIKISSLSPDKFIDFVKEQDKEQEKLK